MVAAKTTIVEDASTAFGKRNLRSSFFNIGGFLA
jgi:hypothetical protein